MIKVSVVIPTYNEENNIEQLIKSHGIDSACSGKDDDLKIFITNSHKRNFITKFLTKNLRINKSYLSINIVQKIPRNQDGKILYSDKLAGFIPIDWYPLANVVYDPFRPSIRASWFAWETNIENIGNNKIINFDQYIYKNNYDSNIKDKILPLINLTWKY